MPYSVYILLSQKDKKLYVGCTNSLSRRLAQHNDGKVLATKYRKPLVLIHQEKFESKVEAFNRERFLKSLWASRFKKKLVQNFLANNSHIASQ